MAKKEKKPTSEYGAGQITVLEGLEPVRKRPGMYIGTTGPAGLHHLIWEVVDNSFDEAMAGHADKVIVRILPDNSVEVEDNGRGIPVDLHKQYKVSALELVLTKLHAGGKFGDGGYKVSGGLHGVGVSVVNALSEWLQAEVYRDGKVWVQEYKCGKPIYKVKSTGTTKKLGTKITFRPDKSIFPENVFDFQTIKDHLRQQAYLTKGIKLEIFDDRKDAAEKQYNFYFEGGIASYVYHLNHLKQAQHDNIFYVNKENVEGVSVVEVALQYTGEYKDTVFAFANNIYNAEGGTHLIGFRTAITRSLNNFARKQGYLKEKDDNLTGDDVREGLIAVISVKLTDPQFEGQTKAKLGNTEARTAVESVMNDAFGIYLEEHPKDAEAIIGKCVLASRARKAAKAARETVLRKGVLEGMALPGKLADCSSRDATESELYIVEGDSAGGCFDGDTQIALADGRSINFKELVEEYKTGKKNYCYTIDENGNTAIALIENPRKTKTNAKVIKIVLDNDEEIICTPDHQFMLRSGGYKEAKNLKDSDSLMPLYRQYSKIGGRITIEGYEMIFDAKANKWIFTHLLTDRYNIKNKIYKDDGDYRHHIDFNKLNNNPDNLQRMTKQEHLELHSKMLEKTIHRPDVKRKCAKIRQSAGFRKKMSEVMSAPLMAAILSERAKKQWSDESYKKYMAESFKKFFAENEAYREKSLKTLKEAQKKYWSLEENKALQSEKTKNFFQNHPEQKEMLSKIAKEQWNNLELKKWRSDKTKEQWSEDFRKKIKSSYNQTYLNKALNVLHGIYAKNRRAQGAELEKAYEETRKITNDKNLIKYKTICQRFFKGSDKQLKEAVFNYNHKIKKIIPLRKRIDVYDLEVSDTHNFALSSGIFVHNSAKQGRNREFQAILPLRGKILNVERARIDKMLANNEIKALIIAMGTNIGEQFNIENLRYHKVIIMTDADVDGAHIRTLLLTFFYRHFPELVLKGHIYIAMPPLYRVARGKDIRYVFSDEEKDKAVKQMMDKKKEKDANTETQKKQKRKNTEETIEGEEEAEDLSSEALAQEEVKGVAIQRYKGLGEMNPDQLWDTTMNPENRLMKLVTVEDAEKADEVFDILMGSEVAPRKRFIQTHAKSVKNLDI